MDVRHLTTFQTVLEEGSFLQAAARLGYSQSTVTLHMQELEAELGVSLFDRRGRRMQITQAGELLRARAGRVLEDLEALRRSLRELRDGEGGEVRVGCIEPTASLRLVPLLARFCAQRPALRVLLEVGGTRSVGSRVAAGELDFGLSTAPDEALGLRFEPLLEESLELLVPAGHRLARARRVAAADLRGERLVLTEQGCAWRRVIQQSLQSLGVPVEVPVEIGGSVALQHAVAQGLGVALVPVGSAVPLLPGTVLRPLADLEVRAAVGLVRRPEAPAPIAVVEALLEELRCGLDGARAGRAGRVGRGSRSSRAARRG